jgi:hypothetical protein
VIGIEMVFGEEVLGGFEEGIDDGPVHDLAVLNGCHSYKAL